MTSHLHSSSILQKTFIQSPLKVLAPKSAVQVRESASLAEVIETLATSNIGCVLVVNDQGKITGIFSERDLVTKQLCTADPRSARPISDFMTKSPQVLKANASIARALHLMAIGGFRHVPIVPMVGNAYQMISSTDLFAFIQDKITSRVVRDDTTLFLDNNALDSFFLRDLSIFKLTTPLVVSKGCTVLEAAKLLVKPKQSACFMVSDKGELRGIFTERDYLRRVARGGVMPGKVLVEDVMVTSPMSLIYSTSVAFAFTMLVERGFRNLPIVDPAEKLIGVLSVHHFIDYMAQQIIAVLEGR